MCSCSVLPGGCTVVRVASSGVQIEVDVFAVPATRVLSGSALHYPSDGDIGYTCLHSVHRVASGGNFALFVLWNSQDSSQRNA